MARLGNDNRSNGTARLVQDTVRGSALSAAEQECDDHYGTGLLARWAVRTAPGHTGTWLLARWAVRQNHRALSANWGNFSAVGCPRAQSGVHQIRLHRKRHKALLAAPLVAPSHNCAGTGLALPHLRRDLLGLRVCLCKARMETYCGGGTSALTCGRLDQAGRTTSATGQHSHTFITLSTHTG